MWEETTSPPPPHRQFHVAIIGAGVSGLRCASVLLSRGFQVTILEARDRIGGRADALGYTVDIGPNWIHASNDPDDPNPIFQIAQDTQTPLHFWNNEQRIYNPSGDVLPSDLSDELSTVLWEIIDEAFQHSAKALNDEEAAIPPQESLYDFIEKEAGKRLSSHDQKEVLLMMSEMFGAYVGEPVWKQSLRFAWLEECCGGDEVFVASTYSKILADIASDAQKNARILLNTYVQSISAPLDARSTNTQVTLVSQDGTHTDFDEVVVTTPLGWLKRNQAAFSPQLPTPLSAAIDNISLSQLEKVFITFPSSFWATQTAASHPNSPIPSYTNWLRPSYALETNPQSWPQEIWDLSSFAGPNGHPTILFYTYGDCSRHIVNTIDGMSSTNKFRFLDDFFRPYYSRLPGYREGEEACQPEAILATRWLKDDLGGNASYCNFQVGAERADRDVLALRDGCPERRLWFCGEHAAPFDECGTVAGAYLSGDAVAHKIVAVYYGDSSDRAP